jgi:hypothetical protein
MWHSSSSQQQLQRCKPGQGGHINVYARLDDTCSSAGSLGHWLLASGYEAVGQHTALHLLYSRVRDPRGVRVKNSAACIALLLCSRARGAGAATHLLHAV